LAHNLENWIKNVQTETIQVLFETILSESKILQFVLDAKDKINLLESVHVIFNFIKDESAKNSDFNLRMAIEILDKMEEYKVDLPFVKILGNSEGVQLLTAHSTKGLEYQYVWIKGADSKNWENISGRSNSFIFSEYNPVIRGLIKEKLKECTELTKEIKKEDERRLFFVAITRAEDELIMSFAPKNSDKKETPSQYLTEIFGDDGFHISEVSRHDLEQYLVHVLKPSELTREDYEKDYLNRVLERFSLSSTALNNFLDCPLKFYYSNIMRMPQARSSSMGFGNVAHKILERLWRYKKENGGWPNESALDILLEKYLLESMEEYQSHFNEVQYDNYLDYGRKMLPQFVKLQLSIWAEIPDFKTELKIDTLLDNIPLTGKLDRVDIYQDHIHVTDYKTGKLSNNKNKLSRPDPKKEGSIGGDYWRQVVFYKILVDLDERLGKTMTSGSMDFIDMSQKDMIDRINFVVSPKDIEIVSDQIKSTYQKIMNHDFYKGCGKPTCNACNLVKSLKSLSVLSNEDDDDEVSTNIDVSNEVES
jgi:DNA helicase-2/ATP-dependent DNA helicase PcrA